MIEYSKFGRRIRKIEMDQAITQGALTKGGTERKVYAWLKKKAPEFVNRKIVRKARRCFDLLGELTHEEIYAQEDPTVWDISRMTPEQVEEALRLFKAARRSDNDITIGEGSLTQ